MYAAEEQQVPQNLSKAGHNRGAKVFGTSDWLLSDRQFDGIEVARGCVLDVQYTPLKMVLCLLRRMHHEWPHGDDAARGRTQRARVS